MMDDVNHSGVGTAENQDESFLAIQDQGLIIRKGILNRLPMDLAEKSGVRLFKTRFSRNLSS